MLTQLEVFTPRVITPPFPLGAGSPATDPLQIRGVDGLGPVTSEISTSEFATEGEYYTGAYIGKRNIVITIGLNPDWSTQTIESLRAIVYSYFMPRSRIRLRFGSTHLPTCEIVGYVESCEPNIFSKDPEMVVSVICPSPNFVATQATVVTGTSVAEGSTSRTAINYAGSVPTGFLVSLEKGNAGDMTIGNVQLIMENPLAEIFLIKNVAVDATQYLSISTVTGDKYARKVFTTPGPKQNLLKDVTPSSSWSKLEPGLNNFAVTASSSGGPWTMIYYEKYGGL